MNNSVCVLFPLSIILYERLRRTAYTTRGGRRARAGWAAPAIRVARARAAGRGVGRGRPPLPTAARAITGSVGVSPSRSVGVVSHGKCRGCPGNRGASASRPRGGGVLPPRCATAQLNCTARASAEPAAVGWSSRSAADVSVVLRLVAARLPA